MIFVNQIAFDDNFSDLIEKLLSCLRIKLIIFSIVLHLKAHLSHVSFGAIMHSQKIKYDQNVFQQYEYTHQVSDYGPSEKIECCCK